MATWAYGAFENDDALEWVAELADAGDYAPIYAAFDAVLKAGQGYVDAAQAAVGLAAAEVVAAMAGSPTDELPEEAAFWVAKKHEPRRELLQQAQRVAQRVMHDSELRDRWAAAGDDTGWQLEVAGLLRRLNEAGLSY